MADVDTFAASSALHTKLSQHHLLAQWCASATTGGPARQRTATQRTAHVQPHSQTAPRSKIQPNEGEEYSLFVDGDGGCLQGHAAAAAAPQQHTPARTRGAAAVYVHLCCREHQTGSVMRRTHRVRLKRKAIQGGNECCSAHTHTAAPHRQATSSNTHSAYRMCVHVHHTA